MDTGTNNDFFKPDELKPKDRLFGYPLNVPKWYTRIFEAIPGIVTWFFLLLPFIVGLTGYPEILVFYIAFLTVYWAWRGLRFVIAIIVGYRRMLRDVSTDWMKKIKDEKLPFDKVKYAYILPLTHEGMDTIVPTLESWANSDVGGEKISVVIALEERFQEQMAKNVEEANKLFKNRFREIVTFVHPKEIPGEVAGVKNPNINWAGRCFVKYIRKRGEKLEDYLVITCDSDQQPHPKYLSAITYKYLTDPKPLRKFYATAIHTFNNNVYRVPTLVRSFSLFLTLAVLHQWVFRKKINETWSSYVVNLKTVEDVGFWDPQIPNDDTAFYYNALIRFGGDFAGEEVYVPTYNDAVENESYFKTHKSLYKQQLRWGWGSIVFPMTFAGLYKNRDIPFSKKFKIAATMFDDRLIFRTVVYLITFGLPILTIISPEFQYSSASYNLPKVMSFILTVVMFFNIPIYIIRTKISPAPKEFTFFRRVLDVLETLVVTINMLTFAFIPYIQAQTEMLLGKKNRKDYYATEKVAIKK